ncbi:MAG: gamma-glutamylcyclotransferase [Candidatus Binatia bacterium]|nr:gamma-glutamylcyclotransferase [Candidatus Binatia bacterium]
MPRYFAYGSNMEAAQMTTRVPEARSLGAGRLPAHRFSCNKIGRDGSAKANIEPSDGDEVWGVVFEISDAGLADLDRFEVGYRREQVTVHLRDDATTECDAYLSDQVSPDLLPTRAYRDRMVRGAQEHELPAICLLALRILAVGD